MSSAVWLAVEKIVAVSLNFCVTLLIARHLMPGDFGKLSFLLALSSLVYPFMSFGLNSVVSRELINRPTDTQVIVGSAIMIRLIFGLSVASIVSFIGTYFMEQPMLLIVLVTAGIFNAALVVDFWLQAHVANSYSVKLRSFVLVIFCAAKVIAVAGNAGFEAFIYINCAEIFVTAALFIGLYDRLAEGILKLRASWDECNRLLRKGFWLGVSGIAAIIYLKIDQVMLGIFLSEESVGVYAAAAKLSEVWYFLPAAIVTSYFPELIKKKSIDAEVYRKELQILNDSLFITAIFVGFATSLCASWLVIGIFGSDYSDAADVLVIHIWAGVFVFMRTLLSKWLIAENLLKLSALSQVSGAVLNVVLNLILIPLCGLVGAAYATLLSYSVSSFVILFCHRDLRPMARIVSSSFLIPYRVFRYRITSIRG